jgi:hypothetical protein
LDTTFLPSKSNSPGYVQWMDEHHGAFVNTTGPTG